MGYVCSVCLSIFCQVRETMKHAASVNAEVMLNILICCYCLQLLLLTSSAVNMAFAIATC